MACNTVGIGRLVSIGQEDGMERTPRWKSLIARDGVDAIGRSTCHRCDLLFFNPLTMAFVATPEVMRVRPRARAKQKVSWHRYACSCCVVNAVHLVPIVFLLFVSFHYVEWYEEGRSSGLVLTC